MQGEDHFSFNQLVQQLDLAEAIKPASGSGEYAVRDWYMTHKLMPILQVSLAPVKTENDHDLEMFKQVVQESVSFWIQSAVLFSSSEENHLLHTLRWFYIGQFYCLLRNEIRKNEKLYDQGIQCIQLIESEKFDEVYNLVKSFPKLPKNKRGRPAVPLWLKLCMAYDFTVLHSTNIKHPKFPNLKPPVVDAWLILDEIAAKYQRIDLKTWKTVRIFQSGSAIRQHLKGLRNLPGNKV